MRRELERRLGFEYGHRDAEALPSKITATELKGRAEPDADAAPMLPERKRSFLLPDFTRAEKPVTGAERGIATHLALQCMDFAQTGTPEAVENEIRRLEREKFLSAREAAAVDAAAFALMASMGLVCDPVRGLVEVPCVYRNVSGVANALTAADLALSGIACPLDADDVIDAMKTVGDAMPASLRETGEGGCAACRVRFE